MDPAPSAQPVTAGPSRVFLAGVCLLLLYAAFVVVRPFLGAVVLAILIGFLMQPVQRRLVGVVKRPSLAATVSLLLFTLVLVLPLALIVQQLAREAEGMAEILQNPTQIEGLVADRLAQLGVTEARAGELIRNALAGLADAVQGIAVASLGKAISFVGALVLFFFLLFFVLRDWDEFAAVTRRLTPIRARARDHLFGLVSTRTRSIALGTLLVSIAQGVAAGIGWWIFGFPSPIFWGFVMTIIAILPLGAPFIVMVPAGLFALAQGEYFNGIGILVWAAAIVGLIDNFLRPFVVGRQSDVHPALILVGTIGGLAVFGVSGFLLGPLLLSLLEPALEVWAQERADSAESHAGL